ncbi:rhodanese-like domain-containing protein [Compostimonas suwonensis]|uniref:Rhodanese-related sulfurtransferase n=1 Tax=Compostimonas suwonensis TaxID=1048394 RepID=A0A2M9BWL7_9MICO|nr:rhodanese-like domain-containing protein [Compostimonas suwonensis]PJJ62315.1 rhodanese-related sulfurtransferase [Compostimonas suwonensis]
MSEATTSEPPLVDPQDAATRVDAGALFIDVRSQPTRERVGAIPGAIIVDRDRLTEHFDDASPERIAGTGDPERPIVVICGSVDGSRPVAQWLLDSGRPNVVHVEGGFPAWKAAGLPTTPGTETDAL